MQSVIAHISLADPPVPVIYKQHPADVRRGQRHRRLLLRRRQDRLWPQDRGSVHDLLRDERCRGIISLNSNVVHDGLVWDVPAVALGRNIWPRGEGGPFFNDLPRDWDAFFESNSDPQRRAAREAYARYLISNQWTLDDAADPEKVGVLLGGEGRRTSVTVIDTRTRVNVVARNRGWFFEDLRCAFRGVRRDDLRIEVSESPVPGADGWIFIRASEALHTPDPERTVVQIHDSLDGGLYGPGGERAAVVARCAGLVLTQPQQRGILDAAGVRLGDKLIVERPVGPLARSTPAPCLSRRFAIGWVGRPQVHFGRECSGLEDFVRTVRSLTGDFEVLLIGEKLERARADLCDREIRCRLGSSTRTKRIKRTSKEDRAQHLAVLDCCVITATEELGPTTLFDALAAGVPVISTAVGWARTLIRSGENGFLATTDAERLSALEELRNDRQGWFTRRRAIQGGVAGLDVAAWLEANVDCVLGVIERAQNRVAAGAFPSSGNAKAIVKGSQRAGSETRRQLGSLDDWQQV
jgi:glycosyltransferase involved in cell wall biosynthesis